MNVALKILLVEDNPGDAALLLAMMQSPQTAGDFRLWHETTLQGGLDRLKQETFEAVLLDLNLPDSMDLDTVRRVRQVAREMPIVVLTGIEDESVAVQALQAGVQDYLVKGTITGPALARSIRHARERGRLEAELRAANAQLERLVRERTEDLDRAVAVLGEEIVENAQFRGALEESRRRLGDIADIVADVLPDAFVIFSAGLDVVDYCNVAYERIWRRSREELSRQARAWLDAVHPDDRPRFENSLDVWTVRAQMGTSDVLAANFRIRRPDGSIAAIRCRVFAIYSPPGELRHVCVLAEEVSPRTR